jgi:hypothetical protein
MKILFLSSVRPFKNKKTAAKEGGESWKDHLCCFYRRSGRARMETIRNPEIKERRFSPKPAKAEPNKTKTLIVHGKGEKIR